MEQPSSSSSLAASQALVAPLPEEPVEAEGHDDERVRWLFRDLLRNGQVNPLLNLVARYRRGGAA